MIDAFQQILTSIGPVFGLVLIGFVSAKFRWIAADTGPALTQFIFTFAIPALIFRTIVTADLGTLDLLPVVGAFFGGVAIVWITASIVSRWVLAQPASHGPALSFAVGFSNVLILGIPIVISRFGEAALPPVLVVIALDVPLMWVVATLQLTLAQPAGGLPLHKSLMRLVLALVRNPIILGAMTGILWRQTGVAIPDLMDRFVSMLGKAALPGALFALGMTLTTFRLRGAAGGLMVITGLKLVALPVMVWGLARYVFALSEAEIAVLTVCAACPVGVNAYLFATQYRMLESTVAGAIALTTLLSALTLTVALALFPPG